jgi:hypothetical protein
MVKYRIKLTKEEVTELQKIVNKGSHNTQTYRAAYILLNVDEGEFSLGKSTIFLWQIKMLKSISNSHQKMLASN